MAPTTAHKQISLRLARPVFEQLSAVAKQSGASPTRWIQGAISRQLRQEALERGMKIVEQIEALGTPDADAFEEHQEWPDA